MVLLNFDSLRQESLDESAGTLIRQVFDKVKRIFDIDSYTSASHRDMKILNDKKKYFDELFTITPKLKEKLAAWLRKYSNVCWLTPQQASQLLASTDTRQITDYSTYVSPQGNGVNLGYERDVTKTKGLQFQRMARANNEYNRYTNATCIYQLNVGGKVCILFMTFDSYSIKNVQVLCGNPQGPTTNFTTAKVTEWGSVAVNEYKK